MDDNRIHFQDINRAEYKRSGLYARRHLARASTNLRRAAIKDMEKYLEPIVRWLENRLIKLRRL